MFVLYLDEFGHLGKWDPTDTRHRHHPLFGLAGMAVEGECWRDLDRGFLRLKTSFYEREVRRAETLEGLRAERWEPKDLRDRRDRRFGLAVLEMIRRCGGTLFAHGQAKRPGSPKHDQRALYTATVQASLRQYEKFLRNTRGTVRGKGVVIMDRRTEALNELVLGSPQSYLFAAPGLRGPFLRIIETPLLVPSEWYHGVQVAHTVGKVVAALFRSRTAREPQYQWAERKYGELVDTLSARIGAWCSVHVR